MFIVCGSENMASVKSAAGANGFHLVLLLCATTTPVYAQMPPSSANAEIIVSGQRGLLGVQADRVITEDEVASYGLNSVGELVDEIAVEQGKKREDVVYLINGQRVMGLGDIGSYPTEAIARIELLPRGAAAQVGGSPNQQVVNISLKSQVRTYVGRASLAHATDGAFTSHNGDMSITAITRPRRINLTLRWRREDALLESDRNIVQATGAPAGLGSFRALRPELDEVELRGSVADQLAPNLNGFVTARLFEGNTRSFLGRDSDGDWLNQRSRLSSGNVDLQLNGELGDWLLAFNGAYGVSGRRTLTGSAADLSPLNSGVTRIRALARNASAEVNATGSLLDLPGGKLSLTFRGRISRNSIETGSDNFVQWNREIGAGVQIPVASAAGALSFLGNLTAGIEWTYSNTTRVGTLTNETYSLQWQPRNWFRLAGSINTGRTPPSVELLAAPILATPGVRYLDPLVGETIDVVALSGGNPALNAQRGNSQRLSLELRPSASVPLVATADYLNTRNREMITVLPPGNNLLLLAFPDRFVRDANGRLTQVDARPLNFARQTEEQLRYGVELSIPLGDGDRSEALESRSSTPSAQARPRSQFARLQFNLSHTIQLKSEVLVSSGFDAVDLLSRDAFGFNGTERPRHEFDFSVGYAERGLGVRLTGQHKSQSFVNLTGGNTPNILRFSALTTVNLRAFFEGQRLLPSARWLKGARFSLLVTNLTNMRQRVRDSNGDTPLLYQPGYRDPTGRVVQFEIRKVF